MAGPCSFRQIAEAKTAGYSKNRIERRQIVPNTGFVAHIRKARRGMARAGKRQNGTQNGTLLNGNGKHARGKRKIRYAVVGLGYISQAAVLPAFAHARENSELAALVSGDPEKLESLSKKYNVARTYTYERFADCLASGEVDAVYLALPNHLHREYTQAAAKAGVHVLCEKPMAKNEQECRAMIDVASQANVKLMIAYRLHFEEGNLSAAEAVREEKIGEPRIFRSAFSQQVTPGNSRLGGNGGGPIYDLGVYCINAVRHLFNAEPQEVFAYHATGNDQRFRNVPEMTGVLMRFPGDRLASFECSFGAADRSRYEVIGTKGVLKMDPAYEMVEDLRSEITVEGRSRVSTFKKRDQFGPELVYFSNCLLDDKEPEPGGMEGLADVRVIDAILESARTGKPVAIQPSQPAQELTMAQEIRKPPVDEPKLVRAQSPSQ
jgi:predicted dehydrogenase